MRPCTSVTNWELCVCAGGRVHIRATAAHRNEWKKKCNATRCANVTIFHGVWGTQGGGERGPPKSGCCHLYLSIVRNDTKKLPWNETAMGVGGEIWVVVASARHTIHSHFQPSNIIYCYQSYAFPPFQSRNRKNEFLIRLFVRKMINRIKNRNGKK